ncbi:hypothetical protein [Saccharothrix sp. HUAS TT1]|uniref:hypothetical protein n=1 Tax=unclassified Saccharothrix TaxID=2593673 RepID=UPI00345BDDCA
MTVPISTTAGVVDVDTTTLTPTAAALARLWSANPLHTPGPVHLESIRTLREMTPPEQMAEVIAWYGEDALDRPHRVVWPYHARGHRAHPLAEELERQAAALPVGYRPVGSALDEDGDTALVDDEDFITSDEVLELMTRHGRPIGRTTLANYKHQPPAGWPGIARYVGRTPQWSRRGVLEYVSRFISAYTSSGTVRDYVVAFLGEFVDHYHVDRLTDAFREGLRDHLREHGMGLDGDRFLAPRSMPEAEAEAHIRDALSSVELGQMIDDFDRHDDAERMVVTVLTAPDGTPMEQRVVQDEPVDRTKRPDIDAIRLVAAGLGDEPGEIEPGTVCRVALVDADGDEIMTRDVRTW